MTGFSAQARAEKGGQWGKRFGGLTGAVALVALSCAPLPGEPGAVGQQASEIINGTVVSGASRSSFGMVRMLVSPYGPTNTMCTAEIIAPSYVLTAGHCFGISPTVTATQLYASRRLEWVDATGTAQQRQADAHWSTNVVTGGGACGDSVLIHVSQPFNIPNAHNFDAPYVRNFYSSDTSTLYGQNLYHLGYGFSNNSLGNCTIDGQLREETLPAFAFSGAPQTCSPFMLTAGPAASSSPAGGDSGSALWAGATGFETIAGILAQTQGCGGSSADFTAPIGFRDTVTDLIGAHKSPKAFYMIPNSGGNLSEYWHVGQSAHAGNWMWNSVGSGWNFRDVTNDGSVIYAVASNGDLRWYRHDGHYDLYGGHWGARSGDVVGSGWNMFRHVIAGGNGILYGIDNNGWVYWYKHNAANVGAFQYVNVGLSPWSSTGVIYSGMGGFTHITSPGDGIFYARQANGDVYWMKNNHHLTGAVGGFSTMVFLRNIPNVADMVARPDGYLYWSSSANGHLYESHHTGWQTGASTWNTPSGSASVAYDWDVGSGWANARILGSSRAIP